MTFHDPPASAQVWSGTLLVDTTPPDGSAVSAFDVSDDPEQVRAPTDP